MLGGREVTQWTDVTGSVPLKLIDDCVSFTSVVSARYSFYPLSLITVLFLFTARIECHSISNLF